MAEWCKYRACDILMSMISLKEEAGTLVTAAVLRGGGSRRFGSSKADYLWKGRALIDRVLDGAALITDDIYLLGGGLHRRSSGSPGVRVLEDVESPGGEPTPLRGICSAAPHVREWLLLLACDIPFFDERLLRMLWERRSGDKAVVFRIDGLYQPFLGLYPKSLLPYWQEALDGGKFRLQNIIESMPKTVITENDLEAAGVKRVHLANINTPGDLEALKNLRL